MEVKNICFSYDKEAFIKNMNVSFTSHKITSIIGPNGSGKSTLLMLLSRILIPECGEVSLDHKAIQRYKLKEFAKKVAVVHQKNQIFSDLQVRTIVGYGRLPYMSYRSSLQEEDYKIIDWAMETTNIHAFADVPLKKLSGGQQQRVWLAMALAQKSEVLLLDEPTTYLDVKYQIEILNLVKQINHAYDITIIMVHHDINQAMYYSDEIIAMKEGRILFKGEPHLVINEDSLYQLYDYRLQIVQHEQQRIIMNHEVKHAI